MIKTITFAILHFSVAFSVAYILTGSIGVFQCGGFGRTHRQYRRLLFSRKSVDRYEKNKSEKQKLWVPLHQCG